VVGYCLFLHYIALGLPGLAFNSDLFLLGWEDLAEEIEQVVEEVREYSGNRPVVVGMDPYQISSGLAFYRAKINRDDAEKKRLAVEETLGWHLFGWEGLMYEFWSRPEDYFGRDVVAVATSAIRVEYPYFQNRFQIMNNIHPIDVFKNDKFAGRYYFRVVHNYRQKQN
jgi:dolichol-phosphate mannosyltransferase